MNKELIKKYKKEFDHWLNEGYLLARVITSDEDDFLYTIWYEVDNKVLALEEWTSDYLFNLTNIQTNYYKPQFIINDEYVELRKALIEGKEVETKIYYSEYPSCLRNAERREEWHKFTNKDIFFGPAKYYRVKPDE